MAHRGMKEEIPRPWLKHAAKKEEKNASGNSVPSSFLLSFPTDITSLRGEKGFVESEHALFSLVFPRAY